MSRAPNKFTSERKKLVKGRGSSKPSLRLLGTGYDGGRKGTLNHSRCRLAGWAVGRSQTLEGREEGDGQEQVLRPS